MNSANSVVYTNKANCCDCYRCLRVCPVKAIRMKDGQASVEADRCIACGTCIRECPQGAKQFRHDIDVAVRMLASGRRVAASVAPSFASVFNEWEQKRLPAALRRLGFDYVAETSIGAFFVARATAELVQQAPESPHICSSCPAFVNYVERYMPSAVPALVPLVSPMIAHAKHIRKTLGEDTDVVFIGPCVAKKTEADNAENRGVVDCVLTFEEMRLWFEREGIDLAQCDESHFSESPAGHARLFPLVGGSLKTSELNTDVLAPNVLSVSGFEEIHDVLTADGLAKQNTVIEPLFCHQGCVNGPAVPAGRALADRRHNVLEYARGKPEREALARVATNMLSPGELCQRFSARPPGGDPVTEEQIREVLETTGKASVENQLNCGACGYPNCRDKAIAVVQGMAEPEMCLPFMRRLAEQRTDRIIETSPNGIVILDERLQIIHMNPAFRQFFMCSDAVLGRPISYLMDADPFEEVAAGKTEIVRGVVRHAKYNLVTHQVCYSLPEERQYVGIFVNITGHRVNKEKLDHLRTQTLHQARELLDHQIHMAQTMAKFLGESTAQGESLLDKLMVLAGDERGSEDEGQPRWLQDTYTSK